MSPIPTPTHVSSYEQLTIAHGTHRLRTDALDTLPYVRSGLQVTAACGGILWCAAEHPLLAGAALGISSLVYTLRARRQEAHASPVEVLAENCTPNPVSYRRAA